MRISPGTPSSQTRAGTASLREIATGNTDPFYQAKLQTALDEYQMLINDPSTAHEVFDGLARAKEHLHLMVPQRFYVHQQAGMGDRHVYATRSRGR